MPKHLKIGDDFIIIDYKPTESLKADDNFLVIDWLAEDHFKVDPSDPSVDPTNPNVDLRPMETPGPDDNVGLPAVQIGGVSVASGDVNGDTDAIGQTVTFTYTVNVDPSAYDDYDRDQQLIAIHTRTGNATLETESHLLYQDVFVPTLETGPAVAMETLTIADEGFWF